MVPIEIRRSDRPRFPVGWSKRVEVVAGRHPRQAGEHIADEGERVIAVPLARDYDRVKDGRSLAPSGCPMNSQLFYPSAEGRVGSPKRAKCRPRLSSGTNAKSAMTREVTTSNARGIWRPARRGEGRGCAPSVPGADLFMDVAMGVRRQVTYLHLGLQLQLRLASFSCPRQSAPGEPLASRAPRISRRATPIPRLQRKLKFLQSRCVAGRFAETFPRCFGIECAGSPASDGLSDSR